jgi:hypothetical protein
VVALQLQVFLVCGSPSAASSYYKLAYIQATLHMISVVVLEHLYAHVATLQLHAVVYGPEFCAATAIGINWHKQLRR